MKYSIQDRGIILQQIRFGESDKFIRIFTQNHGLIQLVAKGVRSLKSKKNPHIDSFNLVSFQTGRSDDSNHYLEQADTINSFINIKKDLKKIRSLFYLTEILNQVLADNQTELLLYSKFEELLNTLNSTDGYQSQPIINFQLVLIESLGFDPPQKFSPQSLVDYFEGIIDKKIQSKKIILE